MRERIRAIDWRQVAIDALLFIAALPFYMAGWVIGFTWFCILWLAAASVAGFEAGRQRQ